MSRRIVKPGVSFSTTIIEHRRCGGASGLVTTMKMMKSAIDALVIIHFRPLSTHSSSSSTPVDSICVGSVPDTQGSVMANALRRSPRRLGHNQRSFCSSVPPSAMSSALPESGAMFPKTSIARPTRPVIRFIWASGSWPKPLPPMSFGRCTAHKPRSRTCSLSGSNRFLACCGDRYGSSGSIGRSSSSTKVRTQSSVGSKS